MSPSTRGRLARRTIFGVPLDLLLLIGLALFVGGIVLTLSALPDAWRHVERLEIALAMIIATWALISCANVLSRLHEQPTTLTQTVRPRVAHHVTVALTGMVLTLTVAGTVQVVASSGVVPWSALLFSAFVGNMLLGGWGVVIWIAFPRRRNVPPSRAG